MKIYTWGANTYGQLSLGVQSEMNIVPAEAMRDGSMKLVTAASGGGGHTLMLDTDGCVYGSGSNRCGQLAGSSDNLTVLSEIKALQGHNICKVECGWESSYAITDEGAVVVWGCNKYGQLGIPKEHGSVIQPFLLKAPHITQVSAGLRHTAMVSADGRVYVCGRANKGQLGVVEADGTVPKKDFESLVRVDGLEDVRQVACGQHHTLALTGDGHLYGWGENRYGQLGEGPTCVPTPQLILTVDPDTVIKAGWTHSAILSGGRVSTWGRNCYSQLGHSHGKARVDRPVEIEGLQDVRQLELGSEHNVALLGSGHVVTWGWNEHGSCGNNSTSNVPTPQVVQNLSDSITCIAAGAGHCIAISPTAL